MANLDASQDRAIGALVGLAVGDALGRPAAADLDLTPFEVSLHGERQISQELAAALGLLPTGAPLAGLAEPAQN